MDSHLKLTPESGEALPHPGIFQKLVGKLIYLSLIGPDISYAVHVLSQFMHNPTCVHHQAAPEVLRYLAGSICQDILLASQSSDQLTAYCDSDWQAVHPPEDPQQGISFYLVHLLSGGNPKNSL